MHLTLAHSPLGIAMFQLRFVDADKQLFVIKPSDEPVKPPSDNACRLEFRRLVCTTEYKPKSTAGDEKSLSINCS